jgi:hypothetical protein
MIYNKRVHIDMYVDVKGTEKEIFEEVNDIINRTITEFSYVDMYTDDEAYVDTTDNKYYEYPSYEYQNKILDEEE